MHPIERLRFVARAQDIPARHMVHETAMALSQFVDEPASLLIAVRRLLDRQPHAGPLAWVCAHALGAPEAGSALWDAVDTVQADRTDDRLVQALIDVAADPDSIAAGDRLVVAVGDSPARALADADGPWLVDRLEGFERPAEIVGLVTDAADVVVEFDALGPQSGIVSAIGLLAAATAHAGGVRTWVYAPTGVALEERMYEGLAGRWRSKVQVGTGMGSDDGRVEVGLELFTSVIGPPGATTPAQAVAASACPVVPELF